MHSRYFTDPGPLFPMWMGTPMATDGLMLRPSKRGKMPPRVSTVTPGLAEIAAIRILCGFGIIIAIRNGSRCRSCALEAGKLNLKVNLEPAGQKALIWRLVIQTVVRLMGNSRVRIG